MIGKLLCFIGLHRWSPVPGSERTERISKWEIYEYADGVCDRGCGAESDIRKEVWY